MKKYLPIIIILALLSCNTQKGDEGGEVIFSLNSTFLRKADKYAVADSTGTPITTYTFDQLQGLSNGYILALKNGLYYILNEEGEQITSTGFEEFNYNFNGSATIRRGAGYGLIKIDGDEILPSEYDSISFITPQLAAATMGDYTTIVDNLGNAIANTTDTLEEILNNISSYTTLYNERLAVDHEYWNRVLDSFNTLCNKCIEAKLVCRNNKEESKELIQMLLKEATAIESMLKSASGRMTPQQLERFKEISKRYSSYE